MKREPRYKPDRVITSRGKTLIVLENTGRKFHPGYKHTAFHYLVECPEHGEMEVSQTKLLSFQNGKAMPCQECRRISKPAPDPVPSHLERMAISMAWVH